MIKIIQNHIDQLKSLGITSSLNPGVFHLPKNTIFEPPCSIKRIGIEYSFELGAFSYGVSGHYFACKIGRYCSFGEDVQVGRHSHPMHWFSTSPFFYQKYDSILGLPIPPKFNFNFQADFISTSLPTKLKQTVIGNDVWIGHGAFILPGINIGHGAVIAAMSVVTKDVPAYAIAAGNPAKIIRYRFEDEHIKSLLEIKWWEFAPWQLKGIFVDDIDQFIKHVTRLRDEGQKIYEPSRVLFFENEFMDCQNLILRKLAFYEQSKYKKMIPKDFDLKSYLDINQDVLILDIDPYEHYLTYGLKEGRVYKRE